MGNFWLSTFYAVFLHLCPVLPFLFSPFLRLFFFDWFSLRPQPVGASLVPAWVRYLVASQICVCEGGSPAARRLRIATGLHRITSELFSCLPTFSLPAKTIEAFWRALQRLADLRIHVWKKPFCHLSMYFVSVIRPPPTLGFIHFTKPNLGHIGWARDFFTSNTWLERKPKSTSVFKIVRNQPDWRWRFQPPWKCQRDSKLLAVGDWLSQNGYGKC